MASSENRWAEYRAGTLTPPVVVQHDTLDSGENLAWVYTTTGIRGPFSRSAWNQTIATELIATAEALGLPQYEIICEDGTTIQV